VPKSVSGCLPGRWTVDSDGRVAVKKPQWPSEALVVVSKKPHQPLVGDESAAVSTEARQGTERGWVVAVEALVAAATSGVEQGTDRDSATVGEAGMTEWRQTTAAIEAGSGTKDLEV
jgi:hypothetical protein